MNSAQRSLSIGILIPNEFSCRRVRNFDDPEYRRSSVTKKSEPIRTEQLTFMKH